MRLGARHGAVATILVASAVGIAGCHGAEAGTVRDGTFNTTTSPQRERLQAAWKRTRERVIEGARRDFETADDGPHGFESCFIRRFRHQLTRAAVAELVAIHAEEGEPAAAQALNCYGVPDGDACGGRRWVPELTEAASGLRPVSR
jgi:hypothetical protein